MKMGCDPFFSNHTCEHIFHHVNRSSCDLTEVEKGVYDTVVANRTITSSLSIIGTMSIIILVVGKRQVFNPKIHPIFALSVADLLLACVWTIGGSFWARPIENRKLCLFTSVVTAILQCIAINLALVYAIFAYITTKNDLKEKHTIIMYKNQRVFSPSLTITIYTTAILVPTVIVLLSFGIVAGTSEIITESELCSCWCRPVFMNVLPYAKARDEPTSHFMYNIRKIIESYGIILTLHYMVAFISMVVIYSMLLKHIRQYRTNREKTYDATGRADSNDRNNIVMGYSKAKVRVFLYLLIFTINGITNFMLTLGFAFWESLVLPRKAYCKESEHTVYDRPHKTLFSLLLLNSALPLQGFLNAIVYGWTREDFIANVALKETYDLQTTTPELSIRQEIRAVPSAVRDYGGGNQVIETATSSMRYTDHITDYESNDED